MSALLEYRQPDRSLEELADRANQEHAACTSSMAAGLRHAIGCGELLNEALSRVPTGSKGAWLVENFQGSPATACVYRRLATHRSELESRGVTGYKEGLRVLRSVIGDGRTKIAATDVPEIRALLSGGHTLADVATAFGVAPSTILRHGSSKALAKARAAENRVNRRRTIDRLAIRRDRDRRAAVKAGGDVARLYSQVRVLAEGIDSARIAAAEAPVKSALGVAYDNLVRVEDAINEAIRSKLS